MRELSARDLRTHLSVILDSLLPGGSDGYTITRNGRPLAVLLPLAAMQAAVGVSVQELADTHHVTVEQVLMESGQLRVPLIQQHHDDPAQTRLYAAAAAILGDRLKTLQPHP